MFFSASVCPLNIDLIFRNIPKEFRICWLRKSNLFIFSYAFMSLVKSESLVNVRECTRQDENSTFLSSRCLLYILRKKKESAKSLSCVQLFEIPWTADCQDPLCMGFSSKNTGVGCHFLLQGISQPQGSNPGIVHCRQILYCLSHYGGYIWRKTQTMCLHTHMDDLANM